MKKGVGILKKNKNRELGIQLSSSENSALVTHTDGSYKYD
jgi:hypothetical protein